MNTQRSSVQALIVVPTRELGMQVRIFFSLRFCSTMHPFYHVERQKMFPEHIFHNPIWGGGGVEKYPVLMLFCLNIKVTKVARMLAAKPTDSGTEQQKACTVMALLDGGMLKRHKTWLKVPYFLAWSWLFSIFAYCNSKKCHIQLLLISIVSHLVAITWRVAVSTLTWSSKVDIFNQYLLIQNFIYIVARKRNLSCSCIFRQIPQP